MWKNALLAFASLILTCLLAEAALRALHIKPPEYVPFESTDFTQLHLPSTRAAWSGMPGFVKDFETVVTTNSLGLHDTEHSKDKDPSRPRLLLLGDSFVEAHQVTLEKTFFKRLEESSGVECIAMGRAGNGSLHELMDLEWRGLDFSPDRVLVFIHDGNDFSDDFLKLYQHNHPGRPPFFDSPKPVNDLDFYDSWLVLKNSWLNRWVAYLATEIRKKPRENRRRIESFKKEQSLAVHALPGTPFFKNSESAWENVFQTSQRTYLKMKGVCDAKGISFAAVFVDNPLNYEKRRIEDLYKLLPELRGHLDFKRPVKRLKETFKANGVPFLDLNDVFEENFRRTGRLGHFRHDFHWNEEGHALVAKALKDFLASHEYSS